MNAAKGKPAGKTAAARRKTAAPVDSAANTGANDVDAYLAAHGRQWGDVLVRLRAIVRGAAPQADEALQWGRPVYRQSGMLCYFFAGKSHVTFGFCRATELGDPDGMFEGTGKGMRHVKIRSLSDIRPRQFSRWVREAVRLNLQQD